MKVIVFTCDSYSWLVPTFLHFYERFWPDNPYKTEFVTETKKIDGVITFCMGKIPWTDRAVKYLESFEEEKFLLLLEDYILDKAIDNDRMKEAENLCTGNIGCVRLSGHDKLSHFSVDINIDDFKEYPLDKPYSISLRASIWQKEFFLEFLQRGENIWQIEVEGSKRIHGSKKKVIWNDIPIVSYYAYGYMKKGRIVKSVEQWVKENW